AWCAGLNWTTRPHDENGLDRRPAPSGRVARRVLLLVLDDPQSRRPVGTHLRRGSPRTASWWGAPRRLPDGARCPGRVAGLPSSWARHHAGAVHPNARPRLDRDGRGRPRGGGALRTPARRTARTRRAGRPHRQVLVVDARLSGLAVRRPGSRCAAAGSQLPRDGAHEGPVMVIGKSLGTCAAARAAQNGHDAVWLTPLLHLREVAETNETENIGPSASSGNP